jgi:hypothetical protein
MCLGNGDLEMVFELGFTILDDGKSMEKLPSGKLT